MALAAADLSLKTGLGTVNSIIYGKGTGRNFSPRTGMPRTILVRCSQKQEWSQPGTCLEQAQVPCDPGVTQNRMFGSHDQG